MEYIADANEMKTIDRYTIDHIGIPSMVLMERAAISAVEFMVSHISKKDKVLVLCGVGNNGADGVAVARDLHNKGYLVDLMRIGDEDKASKEMQDQLIIARKLDLYIDSYSNIIISEYDIVVDAIFGVGLSRDVNGIFKSIIEDLNHSRNLVFAIDLPSGICADTGKVLNVAVKADYTITFGLSKLGLILYPGCEYAGKIVVKDIGFPQKVINQFKPEAFVYTREDLSSLPIRQRHSNKGTFGKVLVIAGSKNMSGACFLSAKAAYRAGAGIVKILTVEENRNILQTNLPEAIMSTYNVDHIKQDDKVKEILEDLSWASVIVMGPGMGITAASEFLVDLVLKHAKVPTIVDADAINIIAKNTLKNEDLQSKIGPNVILTPHIKEMSRLLNTQVDHITNDLFNSIKNYMADKKFILVLKDARTIVIRNNEVYVNTSGNNGMATAGAGDVLTGIIAAFIAQGVEPYKASTLGVYVHGLAADAFVKENNNYSLMASDIIDALSTVLIKDGD